MVARSPLGRNSWDLQEGNWQETTLGKRLWSKGSEAKEQSIDLTQGWPWLFPRSAPHLRG